jgi:hypothetical protein
VTATAKRSRKSTLFLRVVSVFLALLIVAGSLAALVELL